MSQKRPPFIFPITRLIFDRGIGKIKGGRFFGTQCTFRQGCVRDHFFVYYSLLFYNLVWEFLNFYNVYTTIFIILVAVSVYFTLFLTDKM